MANVHHILQNKGRVVYSLPSTATVFEALEMMTKQNLGSVMVVDGGSLVGIFTERDYARKVVLKGKVSRETLLSEIMTDHPVTITPENSIDDCMEIMSARRFRHLPVMEGGQLIGIISIGDVVTYVINEQKSIIKNLEQYISG